MARELRVVPYVFIFQEGTVWNPLPLLLRGGVQAQCRAVLEEIVLLFCPSHRDPQIMNLPPTGASTDAQGLTASGGLQERGMKVAFVPSLLHLLIASLMQSTVISRL